MKVATGRYLLGDDPAGTIALLDVLFMTRVNCEVSINEFVACSTLDLLSYACSHSLLQPWGGERIRMS